MQMLYNKKMKLILASNSPRRKELLSKLPFEYDVIPSHIEENSTAAEPFDVCTELACRKAADVFAANSDCAVIGCDTVVDLNGNLLGKPANACDALNMLRALSGKVHKVHTGVCVMSPIGVWTFCETTKVRFRNLTEEEIAEYVEKGSAMDKAGAYGIQDSGFVSEIDGDYDNVVGFPTEKVEKVLKQIYKR